ncbi:MAG: hypothetical protein DRJ41_05215 [Thermoprotei archaeon]|nr:MAG: hypothetical protein DRJ41_05215 [Thermoprotei archaeon]
MLARSANKYDYIGRILSLVSELNFIIGDVHGLNPVSNLEEAVKACWEACESFNRFGLEIPFDLEVRCKFYEGVRIEYEGGFRESYERLIKLSNLIKELDPCWSALIRARAFFNLARYHLLSGDYCEAIKAIVEVIQLSEDHEKWCEELSSSFRMISLHSRISRNLILGDEKALSYDFDEAKEYYTGALEELEKAITEGKSKVKGIYLSALTRVQEALRNIIEVKLQSLKALQAKDHDTAAKIWDKVGEKIEELISEGVVFGPEAKMLEASLSAVEGYVSLRRALARLEAKDRVVKPDLETYGLLVEASRRFRQAEKVSSGRLRSLYLLHRKFCDILAEYYERREAEAISNKLKELAKEYGESGFDRHMIYVTAFAGKILGELKVEEEPLRSLDHQPIPTFDRFAQGAQSAVQSRLGLEFTLSPRGEMRSNEDILYDLKSECSSQLGDCEVFIGQISLTKGEFISLDQEVFTVDLSLLKISERVSERIRGNKFNCLIIGRRIGAKRIKVYAVTVSSHYMELYRSLVGLKREVKLSEVALT